MRGVIPSLYKTRSFSLALKSDPKLQQGQQSFK
uniref:Uncharacterized protein n=1 Tax=Anguilla anguilla TaxID=7936 RepID=A0A0E9UTP2_ANGAN